MITRRGSGGKRDIIQRVEVDAGALSVRGLSVGYGLPVCAEVSLELRPGEVVAVVGANGTGKSTLLRTIAGRQPALAGEVLAFGRPVDERDADFRAAVAVDLGDDAFFPSLTVAEHLLMVCFGHAVPRGREVVDALLEDFGLTGRRDALPVALSSGQRRRLMLATVFARPRSLMILDEPEQRLDAAMRDDLIELLVEEAAGEGAVLLATHDPRVVERACTGVVAVGETEVHTLDPAEGARFIRERL